MTITMIESGITHDVKVQGWFFWNTTCGETVDHEEHLGHLDTERYRDVRGHRIGRPDRREVDCMACIAIGPAKVVVTVGGYSSNPSAEVLTQCGILVKRWDGPRFFKEATEVEFTESPVDCMACIAKGPSSC